MRAILVFLLVCAFSFEPAIAEGQRPVSSAGYQRNSLFCPLLVTGKEPVAEVTSRIVTSRFVGRCEPEPLPKRVPLTIDQDCPVILDLGPPAVAFLQERWRGPDGVVLRPCLIDLFAQPVALQREACAPEIDWAKRTYQPRYRMRLPPGAPGLMPAVPCRPEGAAKPIAVKACAPLALGAGTTVARQRWVIPGTDQVVLVCEPQDVADLTVTTEGCGTPMFHDLVSGYSLNGRRFVYRGTPVTPCLPDPDHAVPIEEETVGWEHHDARFFSYPVIRRWVGTPPVELSREADRTNPSPYLLLETLTRDGDPVRLSCEILIPEIMVERFVRPDGSVLEQEGPRTARGLGKCS